MRLIDADALWMGKFPSCGMSYKEGWNDALDAATTQAPTIDAEPVVHGRWISEYEYDFMSCEDVRTGFTCDQCGLYYRKQSNYCPNCGAKMDGGG